MLQRREFLRGSLAATLVCSSGAFACRPGTQCLELGWDTPDTDFLVHHIAEYEAQAPFFDGIIVDLVMNEVITSGGRVRNTNHRLSTTCFGYGRHTSLNTGGSASNFGMSYQQLLHTPFQQYSHNLLKVTTQYGIADIFTDGVYEEYTIPNMVLQAHIARDTGCKGLFFDNENYWSKIWSYPWCTATFHNGRTFAEYQARYYLLGQQVMEAWQQGFPGLDVVIAWGYWNPYFYMANDHMTLDQVAYGLLPSFLDGMLAVADQPIYDGYEHSYAFRNASDFTTAVATFTTAPWAHSGYQPSFGLWLDYGNHFDVVNTTRNYFTPEQWQASVHAALKYTSKYVWLYSQQANWFNGSMPQVYRDATAVARSS